MKHAYLFAVCSALQIFAPKLTIAFIILLLYLNTVKHRFSNCRLSGALKIDALTPVMGDKLNREDGRSW